jgi:putative oxidoreductase
MIAKAKNCSKIRGEHMTTSSFNAWTGLRILTGIMFIPHVLGKVLPPHGALGFFQAVGFPMPASVMALAALVEATVAVCLIAGVVVRPAAFLGAAVLIIASASVLKLGPAGVWLWNFGGVEYPIFWAAVCIFIGLGHNNEKSLITSST